MVLGEIRLLQGLQNTETMLRTPEAPGGWCAMAQHGEQIMKTAETIETTEIAETTKNTQLCGGVHPPPGCGKTCDYD